MPIQEVTLCDKNFNLCLGNTLNSQYKKIEKAIHFINQNLRTQPSLEEVANSARKFHLLVQGSNFQVKVWNSLLCIPAGMVFSYQQIANSIALPSGSRAVANAIARNPIGYLIPCHRVIRNTEIIGGYRWGSERKQAILGWEAANASQSPL